METGVESLAAAAATAGVSVAEGLGVQSPSFRLDVRLHQRRPEITAWVIFFMYYAMVQGRETVPEVSQVTIWGSRRGIGGKWAIRGTGALAQENDRVGNGTGDVEILGGRRSDDDIVTTAEGE